VTGSRSADPADPAHPADPGSAPGDPASAEAAVAAPPAAAAAAASSWDRFAAGFIADYFEAHPTFAASAGRHEHDGRLPDWSHDGLEAEARRLAGARRCAVELGAAALDPGRRLERELLLAQIDGDLFWLEEAAWPALNPLFYAAALDPSLYISRDYAPAPVRARAFIRYSGEVPRAASQVRANLSALAPGSRPGGRHAALPGTYLDLGASTFAGLAAFCRAEVPAGFGAGGVCGPALLAEVRAAGEAAAAALNRLASWFDGERRLRASAAGQSGDATGYRLGAERLARMLWTTERIDVPLAAIAEAGRRDLERNLEALAEACARYQEGSGGRSAGSAAAGGWRARGGAIAACMARVQAAKPPDGPVAAARRQLGRLRRFVEERGLAGIPGAEEARVEEAPPHQRWNSAYIDIPGPFDRHLPAIYYIAPPDPAWSAAEREAYLPGEADLLFVSAHEVWPGHFLQFLHSNRASSDLARLFVGYAFAEGWAHYGEEMLWEAGFGGGDPETHIGQLQNALLRNVRLLVAIGLHTGEMTLPEAEAMFREQGFQDTASARQQAARGTFEPAYLNYTLGKLIIRKLRQDWLAAAPGRAWRDFHDRLLSFGGPPLPLVRAAMLPGDGGPLL
jgi:hypothetical protein